MNTAYTVYGLKTGIVRAGDDITAHILTACETAGCGSFTDEDILVIAESAIATAEGQVVMIRDVTPTDRALELGERYLMDPRLVEIVLQESDEVIGGIDGFLLCMKNGTLLPNAGVDGSNAPPGAVVLLPADPDASAQRIREDIRRRCGVSVAVVIADSRTHAMRLGCSGVAIGCAGITSVIDERGKKDLFGRELLVTKRAVADCIASAAELVMGETNESVPAVVIRGLGIPCSDTAGIASIDASECLFMGVALHANPALFNRENKP